MRNIILKTEQSSEFKMFGLTIGGIAAFAALYF